MIYKFQGVLIDRGKIAITPKNTEEIFWHIENAGLDDLFIMITINGNSANTIQGKKMMKILENKKAKLILITLNEQLLKLNWLVETISLGNNNISDSGIASLAVLINILIARYINRHDL